MDPELRDALVAFGFVALVFIIIFAALAGWPS